MKTTELNDLTEEEIDFIAKTKGNCPDCKTGVLKEGPQGGSSKNYYCSRRDECGADFNLAFAFGFAWTDLIWGERLPEKEDS